MNGVGGDGRSGSDVSGDEVVVMVTNEGEDGSKNGVNSCCNFIGDGTNDCNGDRYGIGDDGGDSGGGNGMVLVVAYIMVMLEVMVIYWCWWLWWW